MHSNLIPPCSKCGKEYNNNNSYNFWTVFQFQKPELNIPVNPQHITYYSLCPNCTKELEKELQGYTKHEQTVWTKK